MNRLSTRGQAFYGAADQVASSVSNFAVVLLASRLLSPSDFGALVVGLSVAYIAIGVVRSMVGDPALIHLAPLAPDRAAVLAKDAISVAIALGLVAGLLACLPTLLGVDLLRYSALVAVWIPVVVVQDVTRYLALSRRRGDIALASDGSWLVVQVASTVLMMTLNFDPIWTTVGSWGLGAVAGSAIGLALLRVLPSKNPARWFAETKDLSTWYTPGGIIGQTQDQIVLLIAGVIVSDQAAGALRASHLLLVQPILIVILATSSVLVPWASRALAASEVEQVRKVVRLSIIGSAALSVAPLTGIALREPLMELAFPDLSSFSDVLLPAGLQAVVLCFLLQGQLLMKITRAARLQFMVQASSSLLAVSATFVGASVAGAFGGAWGKAVGAAMTVVGLYYLGTRMLAKRPQEPHRSLTDLAVDRQHAIATESRDNCGGENVVR